MKLLIITQVVDKHHPILGFFHRWVEEFAKYCEKITVICLQKGEYNFPANVTVYTLGKEEGKGRLVYLGRFYKLIWQLRHEYDDVFVHMNQLYVILAAPFWHCLNKKVGLWYAHGAVSASLKVAVRLSDMVFTSTKEGLRIDTPKRVIVGQGIAIDNFKEAFKEKSDTLRLITVGRISQSKNLETLLKACALLKEKGSIFQLQIVGVPTTKSEEQYAHKIKTLTAELNLASHLTWVGAISNHELPATLQKSDIFIHDGSTNSLDKVLLEAALCGCIVVSSNPAYNELTRELAPEYLYSQGDSRRLSEIVISVREYPESAGRVKEMILSNYDISNLVNNVINRFK
jgi:glycosyltransferase involved in cell wall biosynthesis